MGLITLADLGLTEAHDRVGIGMGGSGGIDDIQYTVVPLPPSVWAGIDLLGALGVRRRRR